MGDGRASALAGCGQEQYMVSAARSGSGESRSRSILWENLILILTRFFDRRENARSLEKSVRRLGLVTSQ